MVASTISLIMSVMTTIIASIQCNIVQVLCAVYLNPWSLYLSCNRPINLCYSGASLLYGHPASGSHDSSVLIKEVSLYFRGCLVRFSTCMYVA